MTLKQPYTLPSAQQWANSCKQPEPIPAIKALLDSTEQNMRTAFESDPDLALALVQDRAKLIDDTLIAIWQQQFSAIEHDMTLVAVGGYGRGELHLKSDIDLMIIASSNTIQTHETHIQKLIALLWDIGLDIGHSVRSLDDIQNEAEHDVTVFTNLLESRYLVGNQHQYTQLQHYIKQPKTWNNRAFFDAKLTEQERRYVRFDDDNYRLEPNIKNGPGGLRDIQNILWVAKHVYGGSSLEQLSFLTEQEIQQLKQGQLLLWKIRWGLHHLTNRNENRLLFDLQRKLAELFGYEDNASSLGVEQLMQQYYRTVIRLERLNEMLLRLLREHIFPQTTEIIHTINERFFIKNNVLEVQHERIFAEHPSALLEVFSLMQKYKKLDGVGPNTIRLIRENRERIDNDFRNNETNQTLFMSLLKAKHGVTKEFRRMNRYGILARYLPEFGHLVGRMQFDLFHIYTVDQHSIAVLGNTRRYVNNKGRQQFPKAAEIYYQLSKPELLHLAALYHDIGKGHGGDHSIIGEELMAEFCQRHQMKKSERKLCCWLVRNHLLMSMTAQRQDISDPEVIHEFAEQVGDQRYLNYLYLLTMADINGTNPTLWNTWREQLLYELYTRTSRALRRGEAFPLDTLELKQERCDKAHALLEYSDLESKDIETLWQQFPDEYFLRHSADEMAWQAKCILQAGDSLPSVNIKRNAKRGGTPIFIYSESEQNIFARMVIALDQLCLNVVDARIISTQDNKTLDTFIVLDEQDEQINAKARVQDIQQALKNALKNSNAHPKVYNKRIPRQLQSFNIPTQVTLSSDLSRDCNVLEIITTDRPGILAQMGQLFIACNISILNAKINTLGEKVDDVFYIADAEGNRLSDQQMAHLTDELHRLLDDNTSHHNDPQKQSVTF